jgi:seryl-tRNA synthetase
MLDIKYIRENQKDIESAIKNKNIKLDLGELLRADNERKKTQLEIDGFRAERNALGAKAKSGKPEKADIERGKELKEKIAELEKLSAVAEEKFMELMVKVPTVPSKDTPVGKDDSHNVEFYTWGEKPKFDFEPKDHIEIGKNLDILDLERGAKVGGYRGYYLKNEGAVLVMAAMMHAVQKMASKGYGPMIVPTLVKEFALFGSGYFKGKEYNGEVDEIYQVATSDKEADGQASKDKKFLVGTAEPSLLAYYSGETLKEEDLPIRFCGYSQCYRSEIGSYGKDTKGMYRVHEFMKVEQVVISKADIEESNKLQDEMVGLSKELHEDLGLPYRQLKICTGDMSAGKFRAFDIEAWMPGMERYGETGSASNFLDWQSRRLNVKYTAKDGTKKFAYLLNNTALASPRTFIAILENYQQKDGSVKVPKVLHKYTGFEEIRAKK